MYTCGLCGGLVITHTCVACYSIDPPNGSKYSVKCVICGSVINDTAIYVYNSFDEQVPICEDCVE